MASFLPIGSLQVATYARFFQRGAAGVRASTRLALRILPIGASYGALSGLALYVLASYVPTLLGHEYQQTTTAIRWLAVIPFLRAVHYFAGDALTGAGYQWLKTLIHVSIAGVSVLLNLWLIPRFSWRGSALAMIVSDILMAGAIWTSLWYLERYGRPMPSRGDVPSVVELG
jgi:O-antigen/teichoic acid export membrane protein